MSKWMDVARKYLGEKEVKGPHHNPKIIELLDLADGKDDDKPLQGIKDDETPWCASFVSGVLEEAGVQSARTAWARGYLNWGVKIEAPAVGCIVVFERGPKAGHVGFCVGKDRRGYLMILGGNQSDMVNISPFTKTRVLGYRFPKGETPDYNLPILNSNGQPSKNEA